MYCAGLPVACASCWVSSDRSLSGTEAQGTLVFTTNIGMLALALWGCSDELRALGAARGVADLSYVTSARARPRVYVPAGRGSAPRRPVRGGASRAPPGCPRRLGPCAQSQSRSTGQQPACPTFRSAPALGALLLRLMHPWSRLARSGRGAALTPSELPDE